MPPEIHGTWLMVHSMMSWPASVAMARYRPRMRRLGMPTTAPTAAAISPPAGRVTQNGRSRRTARLAAVYAPTDMKAAWPIEICPV